MRALTLLSTLLLLAVFFIPLVATCSDTQSPEQTAAKIQSTYSGIDSLSFTFSQTTSGQMSGRPKVGKGTGFFAKTDDQTLMRWNYLSPEYQVVISDGKTVSMYFEKLNQMIVSSVDKIRTDILFSFFTGAEPLDKHFIILAPELEMDIESVETVMNLHSVQLQPKDQDSQVRTIHLWVNNEAIIKRIELLDYFDTKTTINLSNIEINPIDLANQAEIDERFSFVPPEGTEIIRQ